MSVRKWLGAVGSFLALITMVVVPTGSASAETYNLRMLLHEDATWSLRVTKIRVSDSGHLFLHVKYENISNSSAGLTCTGFTQFMTTDVPHKRYNPLHSYCQNHPYQSWDVAPGGTWTNWGEYKFAPAGDFDLWYPTWNNAHVGLRLPGYKWIVLRHVIKVVKYWTEEPKTRLRPLQRMCVSGDFGACKKTQLFQDANDTMTDSQWLWLLEHFRYQFCAMYFRTWVCVHKW